MYIVEVKAEELKKIRLGKFENEIMELVKEFEKSPFSTAEIKDFKFKSAYSFQNYSSKILKNKNINSIKIITSGGKVFIVKLPDKKNIFITNKK